MNNREVVILDERPQKKLFIRAPQKDKYRGGTFKMAAIIPCPSTDTGSRLALAPVIITAGHFLSCSITA
jgi:hypothetical protein